MSDLQDVKDVEHCNTEPSGVFSINVDEGGLSGLSALLSIAPSDRLIDEADRRKLYDRRIADRRVTAQRFNVSE